MLETQGNLEECLNNIPFTIIHIVKGMCNCKALPSWSITKGIHYVTLHEAFDSKPFFLGS
jgi:hypothetical protein